MAERFDRRRLVGGVDRARERLDQQPGAEQLRRLREPELRAILRRRDALHAAFIFSRALHGLGDGEREYRPDRIARALVEQPAQVRGGKTGPRGIVHEHPVVGIHRAADCHEAVQHRVAARRAAAVERIHLAGECAPVLARKVLVVRGEHHEHGAHLWHAQSAHRVPEQRPAGERHVLLGRRSSHACAAARGGN